MLSDPDDSDLRSSCRMTRHRIQGPPASREFETEEVWQFAKGLLDAIPPDSVSQERFATKPFGEVAELPLLGGGRRPEGLLVDEDLDVAHLPSSPPARRLELHESFARPERRVLEERPHHAATRVLRDKVIPREFVHARPDRRVSDALDVHSPFDFRKRKGALVLRGGSPEDDLDSMKGLEPRVGPPDRLWRPDGWR